jgi:hypothetical protein
MKNTKRKCIVADLVPELLFDKEYEIFTEEDKYYVLRESGAKLYIDKEYLDVFFEVDKKSKEE